MALRLGMKIKRLREEKGMTQRELAKLAGVTPAYVAQLETGQRENPSSDVLQRVAEALGVAPAHLDPARRLMDPREAVRRLKLGETLREAALGGWSAEWFEGTVPRRPDPFRAAATRQLLRSGLLEKVGGADDPQRRSTYRPTAAGRRFFEKNRLGAPGWPDRVHLIRFPDEEPERLTKTPRRGGNRPGPGPQP